MEKPITPCEQNPELRELIEEFAETLKNEAHKLGTHGLSKDEFYNSGLFRGSIERIRGQFAATMTLKRHFAETILDHLKNQGAIASWVPAGGNNRHDYQVKLLNGKLAVIELKGCLDGNNTNIFDRPPNANEFVIWSVCQNPGANPRHNAWSGIHTRLSAEIISRQQQVDGLVIWDMFCGSIGRPCPKVKGSEGFTDINELHLPPPCIYLFPSTIPSPRLNSSPKPHKLNNVGLLKALRDVFGGKDDDLTYVHVEVAYVGKETVRTTSLVRGGEEIAKSEPTPIRRT